MCITSSVGRGARNDLADVAAIQTLLNLNRNRFPAPRPKLLDPDGRIGPHTLQAIESFELAVMRLPESDAVIAPGDATVAELLAGLSPGPSKEKLAIVLRWRREARSSATLTPSRPE